MIECISERCTLIQWNLSVPDTNGAEKGFFIGEVSMHGRVVYYIYRVGKVSCLECCPHVRIEGLHCIFIDHVGRTLCTLQGTLFKFPFCIHVLQHSRPTRLEFEDGGERTASMASSAAREGPELVTMPSRFEKVQQRGTIDVWWIYDDGGEPLSLVVHQSSVYTTVATSEMSIHRLMHFLLAHWCPD